MNKIYSASLAALLAAASLTGCTSEEDDIFDGSAAQRLEQAAATYTAMLPKATNGWVMQLYPQNSSTAYIGSGYLVTLKFNTDQSVTVGMNNFLSSNRYAEDTSLWEVITDNGPVLTFNSYNDCLHAFSAPETIVLPDNSYDNSSQGTGIGGDYEFVVIDAPGDLSYMMLKGKKRATYNIMRPLEDGDTPQAYIAEMSSVKNKYFSSASPAEPLLHMGDSILAITDASEAMPGFYPYGGDAITQTVADPFLITRRAGDYYLRFRDAFEANGHKVQELKLDATNDRFVSVDDENVTIEGEEAAPYFAKAIFEEGRSWNLTATNVMSDKMKTYYDDLQSGFKKLSYTLSRLSFTKTEEGLSVSISCSYRKTNPTLPYNYDYVQDGDNYTFTYKGGTQTAVNLIDRVSGLRDMLDILSQQFTVTANITKFNLSTVRLTSTSDPDLWFVVTLK